MQVNSYLLFNGQCENAFKFYAKGLGGKIEAMMTPRGTPMEAHCGPDFIDKIIHARLLVGDGVDSAPPVGDAVEFALLVGDAVDVGEAVSVPAVGVLVGTYCL